MDSNVKVSSYGIKVKFAMGEVIQFPDFSLEAVTKNEYSGNHSYQFAIRRQDGKGILVGASDNSSVSKYRNFFIINNKRFELELTSEDEFKIYDIAHEMNHGLADDKSTQRFLSIINKITRTNSVKEIEDLFQGNFESYKHPNRQSGAKYLVNKSDPMFHEIEINLNDENLDTFFNVDFSLKEDHKIRFERVLQSFSQYERATTLKNGQSYPESFTINDGTRTTDIVFVVSTRDNCIFMGHITHYDK